MLMSQFLIARAKYPTQFNEELTVSEDSVHGLHTQTQKLHGSKPDMEESCSHHDIQEAEGEGKCREQEYALPVTYL